MIWNQVRLADICTMRTGKLDSNAADPNGLYPFFTCAQETFHINEYAFDTEAVLLGGNNAAGIFPLKYYNGQFNAYQRTYVIETLNKEVLDTRFLFYSLRPALSHFQSASIGAATQYLTKTILDNFKIALLPINLQRKITNILSNYDELIENNRRRIQLLEESARLLYKEWFVHLRFPGHEHVKIVNGVPIGWKKTTLGEQVVLKYGKSLRADNRTEGRYVVYGSSGIIGTHNKALVNAPGIIVGRKGNVGSVFWASKDYWPIDTVYYISSDQCSYYLSHAIQHMTFMSSDVAVPGLNRDFAYSRSYFIPPRTLLDQFEEIAAPIYQQIVKLEEQNEKLKQARDLLLPRLMNGEIAV